MPALLSRVRAALKPRYRVERELGGGGTARVFLGHDPALDRPVAIKVLRPGRATARAAEAFLEEARTVARLSHPHVVSIHEVGEERGLFYYVMDYVEGDTLRERLERGPLSTAEALRIGGDLLEALGAAHRAGVVHRDVKPENVFLRSGRALLGDFGLSRGEEATAEEAADVPDPGAGTPGYMAPEQAGGLPVDHRSDLYSAGLVIYESLAGRRWPPFRDPDRADWSEIAPDVAGVLRRALRIQPGDRWDDAESFREALLACGSRRSGRKLIGVASLAVAALFVVGLGIFRLANGGESREAALFDLAVLPCQAIDSGDSALAVQTSRVAANALEHLPGLRTASHLRSFRWWSLRGEQATDPYGSAIEAMGSRVVTHCVLQRLGGDSLGVDIEFVARDGDAPAPDQIRVAAGNAPVTLGNDLAVSIIRRLRPDLVLSDQSFGALSGRPGPAVRSFLLGEDAFQRDARCTAERYYTAAVDSDPTFTLARWRRTDLRRYLAAEPLPEDLRWLRSHAGELGPVDRRMVRARVSEHGPDRLAAYRRAIREHPGDSYLLFTYGDELFHRGPLWGIGSDSSLAVLRRAAARDSFLAPAYDHLLMSLVRRGDRERARRVLEHLRRIKTSSGDPECALFDPALLGHAFLERFEPERAGKARPLVFGPAGEGNPDVLAAASRFGGPYLDLPAVVADLGRRVRAARSATDGHRVAGFVSEALGLWARGRVSEALARLDSAAMLSGGPEGRLHAAEWRVVPDALGLASVPESESEAGRRILRTLSREAPAPRLRLRARLALALAGDGMQESVAATDGGSGGSGDVAADRAATLLAAVGEARAGRPVNALALSEPLLSYRDDDEEPGPFFRAALYLLRGRWQRSLGRLEAAGASWLWHESVDLGPGPEPFAGRGEVSWALGAWANARRASVAAELGEREAACELARTTLRHWVSPDASVAPLREETVRLREGVCGR